MVKNSKLKILGISLAVITGMVGTYLAYECLFKPNKFYKKASSKYFHMPYQDKSCDSCHTKMNESYPEVPKDYTPQNEVCFSCHDITLNEFNKPYQHLPAVENCISCHDPHQSEFEYLLKKESRALCLTCHEQKLKDSKTHSKHNKDCVRCHNPHASEYELLLKKGGKEVCLLCHSEEEYYKKGLDKKNLTLKDCISCHKKENLFGDCCEKEE